MNSALPGSCPRKEATYFAPHRALDLLALRLLIGVEHFRLFGSEPWQHLVERARRPVPHHQHLPRIDTFSCEQAREVHVPLSRLAAMPKQILFRSTLSALIVSSSRTRHPHRGRQQVLVHAFDGSDLLVRELGELLSAPAARSSRRLSQESHHQVERRIRKIEERFDAALCLIVSLQVLDLRGRSCGRFPRRCRRGTLPAASLEKAVEIARFVEYADIERGRCLPFGETQARTRVVSEHLTIPFDVLQEYGGDREGDPRRIEPAARQHVMDEPAVNPAVAVFERVNEDEPESDRGGRGDRINTAFSLWFA